MKRNPYQMSRGERLINMVVIVIVIGVIIFAVGSLIWGMATDSPSIPKNVRYLIVGLIIAISVVIGIVTEPWNRTKQKEVPYDQNVNIHVERNSRFEDDRPASLPDQSNKQRPG